MYLSINNRTKVSPPLTAAAYPDRYQWLSLDMAEPNLGTGEIIGPFNYVLTTSGAGTRMWTRNLNLTGGSIQATLGIFETISAANLQFEFGDIDQLVLKTLSASPGPIFISTIFTPTITALNAYIENFEKKIPLFELDQSGAEVNNVPVWTGVSWVPAERVIEGFPGNRLHDFVSLSAYAPGLSADYSYCGTATSGVQIDAPEWRITRLRYSDAGLVNEIGIAYPVKWTERFIVQYTILNNSQFYFNTYGS